MTKSVLQSISQNIGSVFRDFHLSYLPPLMVYLAAGVSSLTSIVGIFFVKDYLSLSSAVLASLSFWIAIPWSLKMVFGHLVDLFWRVKNLILFAGAVLIASSLFIMIGLIAEREAMQAILPVDTWYVISALLAPMGYVLQDSVADAMTVEAVPRFDSDGQSIDPEKIKLMHTTMQTLGRVAVVGGSLLVSVVNLYVFSGVEKMSEAQKVQGYLYVYWVALIIPLLSVLGVVIAAWLKGRTRAQLESRGWNPAQLEQAIEVHGNTTKPNWTILIGGLMFVLFTLSIGLSRIPYGQEIIFLGSLAIIVYLIAGMTSALTPEMRITLVGTAFVIFMFRAVPTPGPSIAWWVIDELKFDQYFISVLTLISGVLSLVGMFIFRRFMAEKSITFVIGMLAIFSTILALPTLGMYYGLHHWTSAMTGGIVDARFIALVDAAVESPLGQLAMIPMLAWIARSAPENLKATYFAVMASFTNLALSASQLGTKYLNEIYIVTREVRDPVSGIVKVAADYSQLGSILTICLVLNLLFPFLAVAFVKWTRFKAV
jgi:MFS family permease